MLVVLLAFAYGLSNAQFCDTSFPVDMDLSLSGNKRANGSITVSLNAIPEKTRGDGEVIFRLQRPGEPVPVGAPGTRYPAIIESGKAIETEYEFKSSGAGLYTVYAVVVSQKPGIREVQENAIYLEVDDTGAAKIVEAPAPIEEMMVNGLRLANVGEINVVSKSDSKNTAEKIAQDKSKFGPFKISGTLNYTDKLYTTGAFFGTKPRPIRNALVCIYDVEPDDDLKLLGKAITDSSGKFTFYVSDNDDGPLSELTRDIRLIVECRSQTGDVELRNVNSSIVRGIEYGDWTNWPGGDLNFTLNVAEAMSGQFNIYHNLNEAVMFAKSKGDDPPLLRAEWNPGNTYGNKSYYSSTRNIIRLSGDSSSNADEFDDDVILHEAGHFMMHKLSYSRSPGGSHTFDGLYDTRLAWSEGWATYFGGMVDYNKWYVDHTATDFFLVNLETNEYQDLGERNEVSVASTLWDIYDGPDDGYDDLSDGSARSWNIFTNGIKSNYRAHYRDFYDEWGSLNYPNYHKVKDIGAGHNIVYEFARVIYPSSSSSELTLGRRIAIKWKSFQGATVSIRLFKGNSFLRTITNSTANDNSFNWRVPTDLTPDDDYYIVINSNESQGYYDASDEFISIYPNPRRMTVNGSLLTGSVTGSSDEDWYYFTVSSKGNYTIETFQGSLDDTVMSLYGKNTRANLLREDDDGGPGLMSRVRRYLYPGTYYVKVKGFGNNSGSYTVRVRK